MLNYGVEHKAKFVKNLLDLDVGVDGLKQYHQEVKVVVFPSRADNYKENYE